jgi:hypothetical protein
MFGAFEYQSLLVESQCLIPPVNMPPSISCYRESVTHSWQLRKSESVSNDHEVAFIPVVDYGLTATNVRFPAGDPRPRVKRQDAVSSSFAYSPIYSRTRQSTYPERYAYSKISKNHTFMIWMMYHYLFFPSFHIASYEVQLRNLSLFVPLFDLLAGTTG